VVGQGKNVVTAIFWKDTNRLVLGPSINNVESNTETVMIRIVIVRRGLGLLPYKRFYLIKDLVKCLAMGSMLKIRETKIQRCL